MNLKLYIICTATVLCLMGSLMCPAMADSIATIHGAVYKMDTYEPLDNALIEVNSTPTQYIVAKDSQYSIKLMPGNYTITARYYEDNALTYAAVGTIPVKTGGDYVYDLLLPPVNDENLQESAKNLRTDTSKDGINIHNDVSSINRPFESVTEKQKTANATVSSDLINDFRTLATKQNGLYSSIDYVLIGFVSSLLLIGIFLLLKNYKQIENNYLKKVPTRDIDSEAKQVKENNEEAVSVTEVKSKIQERNMLGLENHPAKKTDLAGSVSEEDKTRIFREEIAYNLEIETPPSLKKKPRLSADLQEVINVIKRHGGMVSQKDLRSELNYSEVKVSVMLTDLEKMKRIKRFKRGRENIVVVIDWNQ